MMPHVCIERQLQDSASVPDEAARIALLKSKKWPNGSQIHYAFRGGNSGQRSLVHKTLEELMEHVNLDFKMKPANVTVAELRIEFNPSSGAWSYIGTDATRVATREPTTNLGFGYRDGNDGTYMHEFGHFVGAIHEHQNPKGGIKWNESAVIRDLSGPPNRWDLATIRRNMFEKYAESQLNGTQFDPRSIMLYAIPSHWTLDGFSSRANKVLSDMDKQWLRQQYPGRGSPPSTALDLPVVSLKAYRDEIARPGERDLFVFNLAQKGKCQIDILGKTPVNMAVFGPNNETKLVKETNNLLTRFEGQMVVDLQPGEYLLQVSHVDSAGTGHYGVRVIQLEDDGPLAGMSGELVIKAVCPVAPGHYGISPS